MTLTLNIAIALATHVQSVDVVEVDASTASGSFSASGVRLLEALHEVRAFEQAARVERAEDVLEEQISMEK